MKTFLLITLIFALFTGCSSSNAFSRFHLSESQAKGENSILSSKIYSKNEVVGMVSTLYLNQVLPEKYKNNEWFYLSVYTKKDLENLKFLLNGKEPLLVQELNASNEFSSLISSNEKWKKYYLLEFKKVGETLHLQLKSSSYSSLVLSYAKED